MNGAEQVARFSATERLEARLEDLELVVVKGLAPEVVKDRARVDAGFQDVAALIAPLERLQTFHEADLLSIHAQLADIETRLKPGTVWQRLHRLIWGV